jgi:hypothetical protein
MSHEDTIFYKHESFVVCLHFIFLNIFTSFCLVLCFYRFTMWQSQSKTDNLCNLHETESMTLYGQYKE